MPLTELNHYFVRANDLERSRRFYCDVLGLQEMPRPNFPFPGYWLGIGGKIQVHMGSHGVPNWPLYYLGSTEASATDNAGIVDHIAFTATEPADFVARFSTHGVAVRKRYLADAHLYQMFVQDPDGLTIELNFHGITADPQWDEGAESYADMPRSHPGA